MSDVKIGPGGGPPRIPVSESPTAERSVDGAEGPTPEGVAETGGPDRALAELVDRLRAGELSVDQVVEIVVDRGIAASPAAHASEAMRAEIRDALLDMARDDPAIAALVRAMGR